MERNWETTFLKARNYAAKRGQEKNAEDFASFYCMQLVRKGEHDHLIRNYFVDFLRKYEFSTRGGRTPPRFCEIKDFHAQEELEINDLLEYAKFLDKKEVPIFNLFYAWGFTHQEIGNVFLLKTFRIAQIMKVIHNKIKRAL